MIGSKYSPGSVKDYSAKDLNIALRGCKFVANAGQVTTNDFLINDDTLINGAIVIVLNSSLGDTIACQVIDKDNVLGYGTNVVLAQYCVDWYMNPSETEQLDFMCQYPAKIITGLYLRTLYTSVGITNSDVIVNYRLHKVLW